ncbi:MULTISPECIES: hypothetical protein [Rhodanobacter]|uniref:Uncharacterized protein n=1 Tax=Rhodanobacter denitrificans TaxID=666685 RepID=M4NHU8_9GAMM|nr:MULTISPECIES: hypothetical protein [Rhodanobacter]AGG90505.1 hypothetical protein R2APBS1_3442 [Rhodanobacter denitrificans]KZC21117.1 hypothetical protein RHOFW104R3_02925 [Rhodanobacter denitrificans]UJJ50596.1 hypothetical protein LRK52_15365 [Rhodanobacter denitrificans]UJJ57221.1 hypothetical protein LRK55_11090 [Rhodanobacter denitrificans]UJM85888.1 hypothetical protein LRJ86_14025 [Rhodanobacter denitrificans]
MGTSTLAALAGMGLFAIVVMAVVGILLAALVLSVAFRLVVGYMPSYLRALGAVVLTWIAAAVAMVLVGMVTHGSAGGLLSLLVQFLVGAAVVNYLLLAQNGSQIGYGKACVVQLIYLVIFIVLAVILAALAAVFFGGMLAHA